MGILGWLRERRDAARRANGYLAALAADPAAVDVEWLAAYGTGGDVDHARWELRYARRALFLLTAQRDALNDRTASGVARSISRLMERDPEIAPDKREVALQQFNARLRAYADVLRQRHPLAGGTGGALGRTLLTFAGAREALAALAEHAGELLGGYLLEANEALRASFGAVSLPEDVAPSELLRARP